VRIHVAGEDLKIGVVNAGEEEGNSVRRVGRREVVGRILMACLLITRVIGIKTCMVVVAEGIAGLLWAV
jgi:hypothetical protein